MAARIADGLSFMHARGLIHRDVKPSNILLDANGQAHLADFGLARRVEEIIHPTFAGTVPYMSPEQARGEGHRIDRRSDIFSLGIVLYESLTGTRLFSGRRATEVAVQIAEFQPRPLRDKDPGVPAGLDRICCKAPAQRAADRFQFAELFASELRAWMLHGEGADGVGLASTRIAPPSEIGGRKPVVVAPRGIRPFEAADASFFLDLLPGPRDRVRVPESIRFWIDRLEERRAPGSPPFSVGVLYGPSGTGKSSFVRRHRAAIAGRRSRRNHRLHSDRHWRPCTAPLDELDARTARPARCRARRARPPGASAVSAWPR